MLTASCDGLRIEAAGAAKGLAYACPSCGQAVTLRQGQIKVAHFAHKPPTDCSWARGETADHLNAKIALRDAFRRRGYIADYEVEVLSVRGDRRADVMVLSPDRQHQWAIEIQHTSILFPEIAARTQAYIDVQVSVLWVGILSAQMKKTAEARAGSIVIRKYTIRPWEKWAQALAFKELWYVDPMDGTLWRGEFSEHTIHVEPTSWFESGGVENSAGGYSRKSKRWRTLTLRGPYWIHQLAIGEKWRNAWSSPVFSLPQGWIAALSIV